MRVSSLVPILPEIRSALGRIEQEYQYLFVMMGLPLVDGVFLSIVLSGGLSSVLDSIMVGSFILGGGATVGIILSEFTDNPFDAIKKTFLITVVIGLIAMLQASFAYMVEPIIDTQTFKYGAVIALIALSIRIIPDDKTDKVVSPTVIIVVFLIISIEPSGLSSIGSVSYSLTNGLYAVLSVFVAFTISSVAILFRPLLTGRIDSKCLKYATSIGLMAITLSIVGIVPSLTAPIAFSFTAVLSHFSI